MYRIFGLHDEVIEARDGNRVRQDNAETRGGLKVFFFKKAKASQGRAGLGRLNEILENNDVVLVRFN